MKNILVNTNEIETCWEKQDACLVKMKSGKVWICKKNIDRKTGTIKYISENTNKSVFLPLNDKREV